MLPEFLKEFEAGLEKYKLDYIEIIATPLGESESTGIYESRFGGMPYLPLDMEYPVDPSKKPMVMLAQINFKEMPPLNGFPETGILQFFVSADWVGCEEENNDYSGYKAIFHEQICDTYHTDFSLTKEFLEQLPYKSPIQCEHKLSFNKKTEYGGVDDIRFDFEFNGLDLRNYKNQFDKELKDKIFDFFYPIGHRIGGYCHFCQADPRDYDEKKKKDLPLIQIDMDDQIFFGDGGTAHFFIKPEDLKNKNFEKAYFQWDCC